MRKVYRTCKVRENICFTVEEGREQSDRWKTVGFQGVRFLPTRFHLLCYIINTLPMSLQFTIPNEVTHVTKTLHDNGFEAFLVGGCVRDLLLQKKPKDWDVTTNATPEEIIALFPKTFYENTFGTVGVVHEETEEETLRTVEVTPYRTEGEYEDHRHPKTVVFSQNIADDLGRRDFTMNALAYNPKTGDIVDLFGGIKDISTGTIRAVGEPGKRFTEDGLRMLRAIRFHVETGFVIDPNTEKAILEHSQILEHISKERIREEFVRLIMSPRPMDGLLTLKKLGLLPFVLPEIAQAFGVEQNQAHSYDVGEPLLRTLQHAADKEFPLEVRLAALFHDIGKPATRKRDEHQKQWTFYGHEVVGTKQTKKILENLRFPKQVSEKVCKLVRWHMFFSDTEHISLSAVRRMIVNVGRDNIWDLMNLRACDRIGTGRPKEDPYRLRKYHAMIDEALRDPISVGMLKIDGKKIMEISSEKPGPKIAFTLNALLEEVLDDPTKNTEDYLEKKALELLQLDIQTLESLGKEGRKRKEEVEEAEIQKIRSKHWVK